MKGVATSGDQVGHYRLLNVLGEGGMGVVHLGIDPQGRKVAVKVLRPTVAGDATALRRLAREVDTMRRVHSPHVAEIIDADVTAERPYIVTQYVPGRTLEQIVLEDAGPMSGRPLQRLAAGLATALTAIHAAGVIHRDLKPGNVMFLDGEPVLIDFGIAQVVDSTRLTATGMVIGTPGYLAPEVIEGEDAGAPADVHSWAGTLVFATTGRPPFGSGTFESIFYKIMQGTPDLEGVPDALLPVIRSAMARHPAERPTAPKLAELCRRIDLDATLTDQTRVDRPFPTFTAPAPMAMPGPTPTRPAPSRPEPVPAQPKDFVGLLPPAAPPPAPPPASGPYAPSPYAPYGPPQTGRRSHDRQDGRQVPPAQPDPYDPRRADPQQRPDPRRADGQRRPDAPKPPKPYGWYRLISLTLLAVTAGFTLQLPVLTLIVVVVGMFVLRVGDRAGQSLTAKRTRTGPTPGDVVGAVLKSPLGIPGALLTTLLLTPLGLLAGAILLTVLMASRPDISVDQALTYSTLAVIGLFCLGPGSRAPRRQLARVWGAVLPRREIAMVVAACLGLFALLVFGLSSGATPDTYPLPSLSGDLSRLRSDIMDLLPG
ncbi:serine/threonine-protein kinase [Actinomadura alba]|uniref:Protein kinase n=1 Tax=Actinomadura alba TaxID=406431 RepID=A0ABR7LIT4_9ACTN|nr:serine/threonine-protein kinase [Actinomadura alba]MBC6464425.1 protein kinase [Actinomadura alba]